jgi:hypothetical protein
MEFGRAALSSQNINLFQHKFDTFFCREDANPTRIRRQRMIVELHGTRHFKSSKIQWNHFIVCPLSNRRLLVRRIGATRVLITQ